MLRIGCTEQDGVVTFFLEGKLLAPWVMELKAQLPPDGTGIRLNLAGVTFVDRAGTEYLRDLQARGVALVDPSQFVAELLRGRRPRD